MALKLHDTYGYNYNNLKVLLGGWNAWVQAGYPQEKSATPTGGAVKPPAGAVVTLAPAGTPAP